jgi:hypothetical protein
MSYDLDYPSAQPAEMFDFWYIRYAKGDEQASITIQPGGLQLHAFG